MTQDQAVRTCLETMLKALIQTSKFKTHTLKSPGLEDETILLKDLELALLAIQGNLNVEPKSSKVFYRENPRLFSLAPIIEVDELPF